MCAKPLPSGHKRYTQGPTITVFNLYVDTGVWPNISPDRRMCSVADTAQRKQLEVAELPQPPRVPKKATFCSWLSPGVCAGEDLLPCSTGRLLQDKFKLKVKQP